MKKVTYEADLGAGVESLEVDDVVVPKGSSKVVTDDQAKRLHAISGVRVKVEADTRTSDYDELSVEELEAEASRRELEVQGTGANGNVLKKDLIAALEADDNKED